MSSHPTYPGVYVDETFAGARTTEGVPTSTTAFLGATTAGLLNVPSSLANFADFEREFGDLDSGSELAYAVHQFFVNGGTSAWVVRIADSVTVADVQAGLAALDSVEPLNLLTLPGLTTPDVFAGTAAYCQRRRAFFIADPPITATSPADLLRLLADGAIPESPDVALYYPWVRVATPGGGSRLSAPSGTVAGVFARMDRERGVWKAPAGVDARLIGVTDLAHDSSDTDASALNERGINCLRRFPATGVAIWGARTLAGATSEFKYVPVRRMAIFLEQSITLGTQWSVFEPNDEPLRAKIRLSVSAFLHGLFGQGAFAGTTPQEGYFVKCDGDTMTTDDIENGNVNILVGFAPLKPAEFVIVSIRRFVR